MWLTLYAGISLTMVYFSNALLKKKEKGKKEKER